MLQRILRHFTARVLTAGLGFAVVWLTARYLGAAGRGQVSLFFTDVSGLALLAGLVGGSSLIYLVPRRNVWLLLRPAYAWGTFVTLAISSVVCPAGDLLARWTTARRAYSTVCENMAGSLRTKAWQSPRYTANDQE